MKLLHFLEQIERIDYLINRKATGNPSSLANRLCVSESSVHRIIKMMKNMGAPIRYSSHCRSYIYEEKVRFKFGFFGENLNTESNRTGLEVKK